MRTGRRCLLPDSRRRHRIPAGAHRQRTLDFPERQRRTRVDTRPSSGPRGLRRSGSSWPDGGSFVYPLRSSQVRRQFDVISREIPRKGALYSSASLRGPAARTAARTQSKSNLVFCRESEAAFTQRPHNGLRRPTGSRGRPRRGPHPATARRSQQGHERPTKRWPTEGRPPESTFHRPPPQSDQLSQTLGNRLRRLELPLHPRFDLCRDTNQDLVAAGGLEPPTYGL